MEETIGALDKYDEFIHKRLLRSFRPELTGFKELLGEYISHCLRIVSISINELTYLEGVREASRLEYFNEEDLEFLTKLIKLKNRTAHGYNRSTEEELIDFLSSIKRFFIACIES